MTARRTGIRRGFIHFSAPVQPDLVNVLIRQVMDASKGADEVHLLINTPGGRVEDGIHCYNMLRSIQTKITTYNVGHVDSIGITLFLAGDARVAAPTSAFMFHGVKLQHQGGAHLAQLEAQVAQVRRDEDRIGSIISKRSSLTIEEVRCLTAKETRRDAEWAIKAGVAHEIGLPNVPAGTATIHVAPAPNNGRTPA